VNDQERLAQLAALCGILPEYQDLWGHPHACSDETRRSLLGAMRLATGTEAELSASLEDLASREVRAMLPPAMVVGEDTAGLELPAWLPESATGQSLGWRLRLENGEIRDGTFLPPDSPGPEQRRVDGVSYRAHRLHLPVVRALGYHTLEVQGPRGPAAMRLIVTPERCYQPPALERGGRLWGFGVQLYALRSRRNWGMGDFTDLRALLNYTRESGGDLVGVNPLHALFPEDPERASPYSPSSRRDFNVLYLDVEALPDFAEDEEAQRRVKAPEFQAHLRALRSAEVVDYRAVAATKYPVLEGLHRHFRERHLRPGTGRGLAFEAYRRQRGRDLQGLALFQALQEHFHREDPSVHGWQGWPEGYRNPDSPQVRAFSAEHAARIEFWEYLQWQADLQLDALGARSLELGLGVGLYADLAVGVEGGGAETWLNQELYALGAGAGSPPDDFCLDGQNWGLPPMIPHRLREDGFQAFSAMLRTNMHHAGALRIDHVMGLMRLFWVAGAGKPAEGAYVAYPFQELMGILALESQRNHCLVIGEDLGTVPPEVRTAMERRGVLSCHPLFFERDWESRSFKAPEAYPRAALVSVGTHDLPTLGGYWQGTDLELRRDLGLIPSAEQSDAQVVERAQDRAQLLVALGAEGLLESEASKDPRAHPDMTAELVRAVLAFLARSPAMLLEIQPEDVLGQVDQVNLPGTLDSQHPNWRRKLTLDVEEWTEDARFQALNEALGLARVQARAAQTAPTGPARAAVIPQCTYRLQLNRDFTLASATTLVPYLHALGVSHCYASPLLRARPGSPHGYDIIDHGSLNPEIGTPEDLASFVEALHRHGMGLILDFVPNHMAVLGSDNAWWQDVLENGQASAFAATFDIDWRPLKEELRGKVLLPVLGAPYGSALEGGEITLDFDGARGEYRLNYGKHCLPVDPGEYPRILAAGLERLVARLGESAPELLELESILAAFRHLPARDQGAPEAAAERARDKEISKRRLATLWERSEEIRRFIEENGRSFRGAAGDPASFDLLHQLIQAQAYRLAYWRVAADEINYRRFFDINDLAGIRMELEPVFAATHALLLEWVRLGYLDGLRLDHPDGLYDPFGYFTLLQRRAAETCGLDPDSRPLYLVAEKILASHERIPTDWPIHGETGYRFANEVNGLFVDGAAERRMDRIYAEFTGLKRSYEDLLYQSKILIIRTALASELNVLASQLSRIALADRQTCDFTVNNLREALSEVVASFPVYRTYLAPGRFSDQDRHGLEWAVASARKRNPEAGADVFDFIREVLSGEIAQGRAAAYAGQVSAFAMKFQQYTAPVMAKGMEDTCFYRYNRLISLNDVGGDPHAFGTSLTAFHEANRRRCRTWPHGMLASSTHDSKHSEDFRLRLDVLSEMPAAWKLALRKWSRMNRGRKTTGPNGEVQPSCNDEYLLYQTLLGAWPLEPMDAEALARFRERVDRYMLKAVREAKEHTSWNHPDAGYEAALARFVTAILGPPGSPFLVSLQAAVAVLARPGLLSGLSLVLLKTTAPGVPDLYQGMETPVFSLVDPDNRQPVDYPVRRQVLEGLGALNQAPLELAQALLANLEDGRAKCFVTWRVLNCRREHPDLFRDGDYLPLHAEGPRAEHICAFARRRAGELALVVAPRLFGKLLAKGGAVGDGWLGRLEVPVPGEYCNILTGECHAAEREGSRCWLPLAAVLGHFPVALLLARSQNPK
jgi:(1->4)-alpha-D-glucan 1-alpha-D-glucosylmutase